MDLQDWDVADAQGEVEHGVFYPNELLDPWELPGDNSSEAQESCCGTVIASSIGAAGTGSAATSCDESTQGAPPKKPAMTDEKVKRRRAVVAAASRATRAKRKREKEELRERNEALEKGRSDYLKRIAQLQTEVQTLRDNGEASLQKENELLRIEIRKHRAFVNRIVEATRAVPETTAEERFRLVKGSADAALGQVIGLLHTCAQDPTWSTCELDVKQATARETALRVQMLPIGASRENCQRLNMCAELPDLSDPPETVRDRLCALLKSKEHVKRLAQTVAESIDSVELDEIDIGLDNLEAATGLENRLVTLRYRERATAGGPESEGIFVNFSERTAVFDHHYPALSPAHAARPTLPGAFVVCSAATLADCHQLFPESKGVRRVRSTLVEGYVLRPKAGGGTHLSIASSLPMGEKHGFLGMESSTILISPDMRLSATGHRALQAIVEAVNGRTPVSA